MPDTSPRFVGVSRRSFMKGTLGAGLVLALPLSGCGNDDASVFTAAPSATGPGVAASASTGSTRETAATPARTSPVATPAAVPATVAASPAGAKPSSRQLQISFTFAATGDGGRVNNPFVAVWIEDSTGTLVRTVSLWYSRRDSKYLQELDRWYTVDDGGSTDNAIDTVSGGSRVPGAYTVTWDGTDHTGANAEDGDYFVCIEAAREHGPSELVRESIAIGSTAFAKQLTPNGELTAAAVQLVV